MDTIEKTNYRKASPEALYETRKVVMRMWKFKKDVAEIIAATDLSKDTVYVTIRAYKQGGMKAIINAAIKYPQIKSCSAALIILDNLKVYHSIKVSEWVAEHTAQIRLFHLPPYSPEYNPDEYLNNDLKRNIGTQAITKDVQELELNTNSF